LRPADGGVADAKVGRGEGRSGRESEPTHARNRRDDSRLLLSGAFEGSEHGPNICNPAHENNASASGSVPMSLALQRCRSVARASHAQTFA
jgi:hypothetical protein